MRSFRCACGNKVYFENDRCRRCGDALAFDPQRLTMRRVGAEDRLCANHDAHDTCNWLVSPSSGIYCLACSLNEIVPDLNDPRRLALYYSVEKAKRRLLFTLLALKLPIQNRTERENGLSFRILADARLENPEAPVPDAVMTGHLQGCITINLLEADPHLREGMRAAMNEPYRTLLGHFRHESGHYFWHHWQHHPPRRQAPQHRPRPTAGAMLCGFRRQFGDERRPYQEELARHYRSGPPADWAANYVTAYASSHPLEDFAECWAHYLHMVDTLQTAADECVQIAGRPLRDPFDAATTFDEIVANWRLLATTMNDLNRSLGLDDAYPFVLPPPVVEKLRFVHGLIAAASA